MLNVQVAPYPIELEQLVNSLTYKKNWNFYLQEEDRGQESKGLTLVIAISTPDSYHPDEIRRVNHLMIVPAASYDERSWQRWLFEQICLVETHEAMEFFQVEGVRPYAPSHGPGNDPYMVREIGTATDQKTSFRGELND